jgi:hypothetical protein
MNNVPPGNRLRNALSGLLVSYGWVSFMFWMWLNWRWIGSAPIQPDQALGLVYRHNEHGALVYLSALQSTTGALIFMTSIPLLCLGMWIGPKKNLQVRRGWLSIRANWDRDDPAGLFWWAAAVGAALTPLLMVFVGRPLIEELNRLGFVLNLG